MSRRIVYVVITPSRVFVFGAHALAERFERRAKRLPSMAGQTIERTSAFLRTGRKAPVAVLRQRTDAAFERRAGGEAH